MRGRSPHPPVMSSCKLRSAVVASDLLLQITNTQEKEQPGLLQGFSVWDVLHVPHAPQIVRHHQSCVATKYIHTQYICMQAMLCQYRQCPPTDHVS